MPRALVTGGAGFIGSNVARLLLDEGYDVTILDNFTSGYRSNVDALPAVEVVEGDVRDPDTIRRAMGDASVVFHLAASVGNFRSIEHPIQDSETNVLGTLRLLETARALGVGKVVYSSSAGIFGELKNLPIREDHPVEPDSPYGASKLAGEKLCLAYAKLYDLEAIALRYFNVYGPNQRYDAYGNVIPIFAERLLRGDVITVYDDGEQTRDFVNVRDVAEANLRAARANGVSGAFNIASATQITINRLVALMKEASGLDAAVEYAPPRPGDVRDSVADIGAARALLGYEPSVGLEEGLAEYMEWAQVEAAASV
jgi:UDP-glucose 4-epimerase